MDLGSLSMQPPELLPLVSAVISTRNRPVLVMRAVESALRQTYPAIEVVVVLDGLDPRTLEALGAIEDSRLRVISLAERGGVSEARNRGVLESSGEWIALLDDDDEWQADKIEKQVAVALRAANPFVLVFSQITVRLPHIDYIWPHRAPASGEAISDYLYCRKGFSFGEGFLQTSCFFASRQMFLEVPFRKGQHRYQDTDWVLRACMHPGAQVEVVLEPLAVYYRDHDYEGQQPPVSREPDWEYLYRWGAEHRDLFTPRAFSFFIATQCVPHAARQRAPLSTFVWLLRHCVFGGRLTLNCAAIFFVFWFVPEGMRCRIRDSAALLRRRVRGVRQPQAFW